jgi:hypothetical protein
VKTSRIIPVALLVAAIAAASKAMASNSATPGSTALPGASLDMNEVLSERFAVRLANPLPLASFRALAPAAQKKFGPFLMHLYSLGYRVTWLISTYGTHTQGSRHYTGHAIDINLLRPDGRPLRKAGYTAADWQPVADIAALYGIRWGGLFNDINHFDVDASLSGISGINDTFADMKPKGRPPLIIDGRHYVGSGQYVGDANNSQSHQDAQMIIANQLYNRFEGDVSIRTENIVRASEGKRIPDIVAQDNSTPARNLLLVIEICESPKALRDAQAKVPGIFAANPSLVEFFIYDLKTRQYTRYTTPTAYTATGQSLLFGLDLNTLYP